jgi:hypothetical protein
MLATCCFTLAMPIKQTLFLPTDPGWSLLQIGLPVLKLMAVAQHVGAPTVSMATGCACYKQDQAARLQCAT